MVTDVRAGMDDLKANLAFLDDHHVRFGWLSQPDPSSSGKGTGGDNKKDDDGKTQIPTVAQVARAHELSLGNLKSVQPPRSVLNATVDEKTVEIEEAIGDFIGPVIEGEIEATDGMNLLGEFVADLAKRRYQSQKGFKPLSDERKRQKTRGGKSGDKARLNFGQEVNSLRSSIASNAGGN